MRHIFPPPRPRSRWQERLNTWRLGMWEVLSSIHLGLKGAIGTVLLLTLGVAALLALYAVFRASCRAKEWLDQYV